MLRWGIFAAVSALMIPAPAVAQTACSTAVSKPCKTSRPNGAKVTVTVAVAKQEDAPLQIAALRLPDPSSRWTLAILNNRSSKPVRAFWIGVIFDRPDETGDPGGGVRYREFVGTSSGPVQAAPGITVSPEQQLQSQYQVLQSHALAYLAKLVGSNCVHAAVVISRVDFEDGTNWEFDQKQASQLWRDTLATRSGNACGHDRALEGTLRRLDGSGYESGPFMRMSPREAESYSFSCVLCTMGTRWIAMCPF